MCTDTIRSQHARKGPGLPSDLTDAEWALLEPFLPPASPFGRPREWPMRQIVDAISQLAAAGNRSSKTGIRSALPPTNFLSV